MAVNQWQLGYAAAFSSLDQQGIKDYQIGGKSYRVKRCYEWYNDESRCEWWIYPAGTVAFGYIESGEFYEAGSEIARVELVERFYSEDEEHHEFPSQLEVAAALAENGEYELTPKEEMEWTVRQSDGHLKALKDRLGWMTLRRDNTRKAVETARQRAEEEAEQAQKDYDKLVAEIAAYEVKVADAHVRLNEYAVG